MSKITCSACKKKFDYDKYYGLCPKCGVYNKKEQRNTMQPSAMPIEPSAIPIEPSAMPMQPVEKQQKGIIKYLVVIAIVAILITAIGTKVLEGYLDTYFKNQTQQPTVVAGASFTTEEGVTYEVKQVKELIPEGSDRRIPKGQKLMGVFIEITHEKGSVESSLVPLLGWGENYYKENIYPYKVEDMLADCGYSRELILDKYDYFGQGFVEGIYPYLVDADAKDFKILVQKENTVLEETYVEEVYRLELPLESEVE